LAAYLLAGTNVYLGAFKTIRRGDFFDENVLRVPATLGRYTSVNPEKMSLLISTDRLDDLVLLRIDIIHKPGRSARRSAACEYAAAAAG